MPKKPSRKTKTRSRKPKPRQKQKQKQKQIQKVSVNVSGGGSGSGGFIPIPQAPSFDYSLLANLIRPAATVDMPIAAQAMPIVAQARQTRPAPPIPMGSSVESRFGSEPIRESFSSSSAKMPSSRSSVSFESSESETDVPFRMSSSSARPSSFYRSSGFIPPTGEGSGKKTRYEEDIFGRSMPTTSDIRGSSVESRFGYEPMRESFSASSAKAPSASSAKAPMRIPKQPAESKKSSGGGGSSNISFEPSESNRHVPYVPKATLERPSSFYRSSGFIPPTGEGSGKKTKYETDIFGRDMPMTSNISASPSFEATGGGRKKPNIVSYLDLPSGGESETFERRAYLKMRKK